MRHLSLLATCIYGLLVLFIVLFPGAFTVNALSWFLQKWAVITALYIVLQVLPMVWILYYVTPYNKACWDWEWRHADTISSYVLVALVIIISIILLFLGPSNFWQGQILQAAFVAAIADFLIARIQDRVEELAPPPPAP